MPEGSYTVSMSQVVDSGTGTCFYTFFQTRLISISNINFINNTSKSPWGFFGNDRSNDYKLIKCCLKIPEGTAWFGSSYADSCKCSFDDSVFSGYLPPQHSYVDTSSLRSVGTLSTVRIKRIKEGICRNGSSNFSASIMLHMRFLLFVSAIALLA